MVYHKSKAYLMSYNDFSDSSQIGRYSEAADAAVTVLAAQPKHSIMTQNLQQYIKDYNVDASIMTNQEQQVNKPVR